MSFDQFIGICRACGSRVFSDKSRECPPWCPEFKNLDDYNVQMKGTNIITSVNDILEINKYKF